MDAPPLINFSECRTLRYFRLVNKKLDCELPHLQQVACGFRRQAVFTELVELDGVIQILFLFGKPGDTLPDLPPKVTMPVVRLRA